MNSFLKTSNFDVATIVQKGYDAKKKEKYELTALNAATKESNIDIVKLLLSYKNIDVNRPNIFEYEKYKIVKNALFIAVEVENVDIINILLEHGVDINFLNIDHDREKTALEMAAEKGNHQIIELLLKCKNINPNIRFNKNGFHIRKQISIIFDAVYKQNINIVKLLLAHPQLNVNLSTIQQRDNTYGDLCEEAEFTPLNAAINSKNIEIIQLLLSNSKINVNIPIIYSRFPRSEKTTDVIKNPLLLGIETKDIEIVKLLISFDNLDINAKNIL